MEKIIAVDPGKFEIKAALLTDGDPKLVRVRSKLYTLKENQQFDPQGNSKYVAYDKGRYIIGDQGNEADLTFSKDTMLHKVGLMAVLSELAEEGDQIKLILGCPASIYKDKSARNAYKDFMTDSGILSFETTGAHFEITVATTLVVPESSGAPYMEPGYFKDARVAVVDMGGLNLNFSVYNDMVLELDSMHTINHGGYELEAAIKNQFGARYGVALARNNIEDIIANGHLVMDGKEVKGSKDLLEQIYEDFISKIPNHIKEFDYNLSLMKALFIGGTSYLLGEERIKKTVVHAKVQEDGTWTNVLGFLKIGRLKYKSA
jgi:plasmid segregation protein ParM